MREENASRPYANKYVMMFIIFWLGVLTGALALLMLRGGTPLDNQASLLTTPFNYYQYVLPTPTTPVYTLPITNPITDPTIPEPPGW